MHIMPVCNRPMYVQAKNNKLFSVDVNKPELFESCMNMIVMHGIQEINCHADS